ncbi:transglutaminase-like domain-containing protein [Bifidobacterium actinocoloniiforme]|uniref:transglutaminase-like domain-containing protein n=1 Tax=Bifidobacterium actinocoloniiforme TaxID=638619 RepID=UPI000529D8C5|nr:transglutaminase-like domain-containing protein [Bifidobacterium actinocoloniiforme]AKV54996.1 hypothetical protein AB656_00435 [Bifidobacterium actinocoloniiforme DSM 22766]
MSGFKLLICEDPPLGRAQGAGMALWTLLLWTGYLAGRLALVPSQVHGWPRTRACGAVVPLATMAASAFLGTREGWHTGPTGLALALALAFWSSDRPLRRRAAAKLVCALTACGLSLSVQGLAPGRRLVLREHYQPPTSIVTRTSPLSTYRAYLKDFRQEPLLEVEGLPSPAPIRLAVLDAFDGQVWTVGGTGSTEGGGYRRLGRQQPNAADNQQEQPTAGPPFVATFHVHAGLGPGLMPSVGHAERFDRAQAVPLDQAYYDAASAAALAPAGLAGPFSYREQGHLPPRPPSRQAIASARAAPVTQPPLNRPPAGLTQAANRFAGTTPGVSAGRKALNLADALRSEGWFSHGLAGDYPSQAGHGSYRIERMLRADALVGDSEQYASLMALMARQEGLSARVVLGFLPQQGQAAIDAEAQSVPSPKPNGPLTFTGEDMQAWVEVDLEGLGWVAFHPTPPQSRRPQTDRSERQKEPNRARPPLPLSDPLREGPPSVDNPQNAGSGGQGTKHEGWWERVGPLLRAMALWTLPLWVCTGLLAGLSAASRRSLRLLKLTGTPRERILAGWRFLIALARRLGVPVSGRTRSQQAQTLDRSLHAALGERPPAGRASGPEANPANALALLADQAAFSTADCSPQEADLYWQSVDRAAVRLLSSKGRFRRWAWRLIPLPWGLRVWRPLKHTRAAATGPTRSSGPYPASARQVRARTYLPATAITCQPKRKRPWWFRCRSRTPCLPDRWRLGRLGHR